MNTLGDGIKIAILCDYTFIHEWMAFACWYSISKNIPDAEVFVVCNPSAPDEQLFDWARKLKIKIIFEATNSFQALPPLLKVSCDTVAVRELSENDLKLLADKVLEVPPSLCCDAKIEEFYPFASYREGCGKFVASRWIDKVECPLSDADRLMTHSASVNEVRILKLWKQSNLLYTAVARG